MPVEFTVEHQDITLSFQTPKKYCSYAIRPKTSHKIQGRAVRNT